MYLQQVLIANSNHNVLFYRRCRCEERMSFLLILIMLRSKGHLALSCPSPVGRLACSSLAQNFEHRTYASACSRKVAWSCRPLAAVYTFIALQQIRPEFLERYCDRYCCPGGVDGGVRCSRSARSPSKLLWCRRLGGGIRCSVVLVVP